MHVYIFICIRRINVYVYRDLYMYGMAWILQVGSYFVGQYYQVLQQQPDLVHQFYSDASSMVRIDGDSTETASEILVNSIFFQYYLDTLCDIYTYIYIYSYFWNFASM